MAEHDPSTHDPANSLPTNPHLGTQNRYQADADMGKRMGAAFALFTLTRPRNMIIFGIFIVLIVLMFVTSQGKNFFGAYLAVGLVAAAAFSWFRMSRAMKRQVQQILLRGSTFTTSLGENDMVISSPLASSTVSYGNFRSIHVYRHFVFLRVKNANFYQTFPLELFPGESVEYVRNRIEAARVR